MEQIIISSFAENKLMDLAEILHQKEYFGFRADAKNYVDGLRGFIETIPEQKHYKTRIKRHGEWYSKYRHNRQTTWFITFDKEADIYLIKNIINNHTKDYPAFIAGLRS